MSLTAVLACLLHQPVRTLEQPLVYTTPLGYWAW